MIFTGDQNIYVINMLELNLILNKQSMDWNINSKNI